MATQTKTATYKVIVNMRGWRQRYTWTIWNIEESRDLFICYERYCSLKQCRFEAEEMLQRRFGYHQVPLTPIRSTAYDAAAGR